MRIEITDSPKSEAAAAVFKRKVDCVLFKDQRVSTALRNCQDKATSRRKAST